MTETAQKHLSDAMPDRLIARREVCAIVGLSPATVWRKVRAGEFPPGRQVSDRSVRWSEAEIRAWLKSRPFQPCAGADVAAA